MTDYIHYEYDPSDLTIECDNNNYIVVDIERYKEKLNCVTDKWGKTKCNTFEFRKTKIYCKR